MAWSIHVHTCLLASGQTRLGSTPLCQEHLHPGLCHLHGPVHPKLLWQLWAHNHHHRWHCDWAANHGPCRQPPVLPQSQFVPCANRRQQLQWCVLHSHAQWSSALLQCRPHAAAAWQRVRTPYWQECAIERLRSGVPKQLLPVPAQTLICTARAAFAGTVAVGLGTRTPAAAASVAS